jgi:hypothetical protein
LAKRVKPKQNKKPVKSKKVLYTQAKKPNTKIVPVEVKTPIIETPEKEAIIQTENVTPLVDRGNGYVQYDSKLYQENALRELRPDLFLTVDTLHGKNTESGFGTAFPKKAMKGDIFVRVDVLPNKAYKFDGNRWLEINKELSHTYLYNDQYMEFLIDKINKNEYDVNVLTDVERLELENFLNKNKGL